MASLLSWLGNTAKDIERNIGNFVGGVVKGAENVAGGAARGVQRNIVNPVVREVQQAPRQIANQAITAIPGIREVNNITDNLLNVYKNIPQIKQAEANQAVANALKPVTNIPNIRIKPLEAAYNLTHGNDSAPITLGGVSSHIPILSEALQNRTNGDAKSFATNVVKTGAEYAPYFVPEAKILGAAKEAGLATKLGVKAVNNFVPGAIASVPASLAIGKTNPLDIAKSAVEAGAGNAAFTVGGEAIGKGLKTLLGKEAKTAEQVVASGVLRKPNGQFNGSTKGTPKPPTNLLKKAQALVEPPKVTAARQGLEDLTIQREGLLARGLTENHPAVRANEQAYQDLSRQLQAFKQGGYIGLPGKNSDPIVNKQTGETLSQSVEKLRKYGWSEKDITAYSDAVLGKSKKVINDPNILTDLNPTGSVLTDYNPQSRMKMKLGDNITTLDKTMERSPDELITIYRGAPKSQTKINPGDFVTTSKELAQSYSGTGNVIEQKVPLKHVLDDLNNPLGDEYIYRPKRSWIPDEGGYIGLPKSDSAERTAQKTLSQTGRNLDKPLDNVTPTQVVGEISSYQNPTTKQYVSQQVKAAEKAAKSGSKGRLQQTRETLSTKFIDALAPIERPVEKAAGGRDNTVALRNALDRSLRSETIAGQYVKDKGLAGIIQSVDDADTFGQYLIAKRAAEVSKKGIVTGRDAVKDAQLVTELSGKYEPLAGQIRQYTHNLLDTAVDDGILSKEAAAYLKKEYPDYVPLQRVFGDGELLGGNGAGPASLSKQTVVQRLKGSEREVVNPLESLLTKTRDVVGQGERNKAAREIVKTMDLPGNPLGLRELKPDEAVGSKATISYLENGVKKIYETTPEVAAAAKSLNKEQWNIITKAASLQARALRLGATGVNAGFALANVVKDTGTTLVNNQNRRYLLHPEVFLKSLASAFYHGGKSYGELVREGAAGTSFDIGRQAAKQTVKRIKAERGVSSKILYTVTHPSEYIRAVEDTIGRSEDVLRAANYYSTKKAAQNAGKANAAQLAADAARTNTTNFARAGEYGRVANTIIPYLNAGIQGARTFNRMVRDKPLQTATAVTLTAFMPMAATTAWALADPKRREAWNDIKDYEKDGNFILVPPNPVKNDKGDWNIIKIPMSQQIAQVNSGVRNAIEAMAGDKDFDFGGLLANLTGTATSISAEPRKLANQLLPQATKPFIEGLTNKNLFTGNSIVPDSKKELDAPDQYGKNTSGTAKVIGRNTGLSPYHIDNFLRTSFGGAGQNVLRASDKSLAAAGVIKPDEVKGRSLGESITGRFYGAQGQSEYEATDKQIAAKQKELKALSGYKELSPEDKAKALNRVKNSVLSDKKKGTSSSREISSYLTAQDTSNMSPRERYESTLKKYNEDKQAGKISDVADLKRKSQLTRLKAQSNFSQDAVDLYAQSFKNIVSFVNSNKNGQKLWDEVKQLDKAMTDAGYTSKLYNKNGSLKATVSGKSGRKSSGRKSAKGKVVKIANFNIKGNSNYSVKIPKAGSLGTSVGKLPVSKLPKIKINKLIA